MSEYRSNNSRSQNQNYRNNQNHDQIHVTVPSSNEILKSDVDFVNIAFNLAENLKKINKKSEQITQTQMRPFFEVFVKCDEETKRNEGNYSNVRTQIAMLKPLFHYRVEKNGLHLSFKNLGNTLIELALTDANGLSRARLFFEALYGFSKKS